MPFPLSNKAYDILKFIALYLLPGLGSLYLGLSTIWGLPYGGEIVGSIVAIDSFLGVILDLNKTQFSMAASRAPTQPSLLASDSNPNPVGVVIGMDSKTYDVLYWIAQVFLPAVGTLYFALANVWALPYAEQIVGTITVLDTFLGVMLGISTAQLKAAANKSFKVFTKPI